MKNALPVIPRRWLKVLTPARSAPVRPLRLHVSEGVFLPEIFPAVVARQNEVSEGLLEWFKEGVKPEHFVVSGLGKQLINVPATS